MRVRVLRSPQCVALIGRAPGRRSWRLRVRVPSQSATCSRAKAAKANRWGLISPVDSRNCFRQGYSSAAIRSMRTNGTCGCDSHCPAYGLLATTGRAPVLQAGGYGFESRTVHGCSRKRCSYLALHRERSNHTVSPSCGAGWREAHLAEFGRRAGFRFQCLWACGFESHNAHGRHWRSS